jgi:hypothetical protein
MLYYAKVPPPSFFAVKNASTIQAAKGLGSVLDLPIIYFGY